MPDAAMKDIVFFTAKNGAQTCAIQNCHIHSAYDPQREAERFVQTIAPSFVPSCIVVVEPALSYCVQPLHERFPNAKLIAVRLEPRFKDTDVLWHTVFDCTDKVQAERLGERLFSCIGDQLAACVFVDWKPAASLYPELHTLVWQQIQYAVSKNTDVLATQAYFAKRWIRNAVRLCVTANTTVRCSAGTQPVLFCASGPSLTRSIPFIAQYRDDFFLLAASSAYEPLAFAGIVPDACISTDGSFWAKKHIRTCSVPLIVSAESALPCQALSALPLAVLRYGDSLETLFLDSCHIPAYTAVRNGTVSGTAIEFALTLTSGPVYACGLDLCTAKGQQHAQPNCLETDDSLCDFRLTPAATRTVHRECNAQPIALYRRWFCDNSERFTARVSRIFDQDTLNCGTAVLGCIPDIAWRDYAEGRIYAYTKPKLRSVSIPANSKKRAKTICSLFAQGMRLIQQDTDSPQAGMWLSSLIPAAYAAYAREPDKSRLKADITQKAAESIAELTAYAKRCAGSTAQ